MLYEDSSCLNKRRYDSKEQAISSFKSYKATMQRNRGRRVKKIRAEQYPYKCIYCDGWHLTTRG